MINVALANWTLNKHMCVHKYINNKYISTEMITENIKINSKY